MIVQNNYKQIHVRVWKLCVNLEACQFHATNDARGAYTERKKYKCLMQQGKDEYTRLFNIRSPVSRRLKAIPQSDLLQPCNS